MKRHSVREKAPGISVRVLGIIPARGGSKGIPGKNIALLNGHPLIYHTITAARKARRLDAFVISTDDEQIAAYARELCADVPFMRPKSLAGDSSPDIGYLRHGVRWLEAHRGWKPEIVVILRPTSPLRTAADIDNVVEWMDKTGCDSVRTVSLPDPFTPFKMWFRDSETGAIQPVLRTRRYRRLGTDVPRQELPRVYWQNGLVDATRTCFIRRGLVWGQDIRGLVVEASRAVDLDSPKDLRVAEAVVNRRRPKRRR